MANDKASTALAVVHQSNGAIEPRDMNELRAMAKDAAGSHFYGAKTPEQAMMILMAGRDLGLSYAQSLRAFHVIKDAKIALSAQGMMAVCLQHRGVCKFFRVTDSTPRTCTVETQREGDPPRALTFTFEEAATAGLTALDREGKPGMYQKYPAAMLKNRAISMLAREVFPDLLLGLYEEDEAREIAEDDLRRHPRTARAQAPIVQIIAADDLEAPGVDAVVLAFGNDLDKADSLEALGRVGKAIAADTRLHDGARAFLRDLFGKRRQALVSAAGEVPAARPTPAEPVAAAEREPGEEG